MKKAQDDLDLQAAWMEGRYKWVDVCGELRRIMLLVEEVSRRKIGADTGVWIENLTSAAQRAESAEAFFQTPEAAAPVRVPGQLTQEEIQFRKRYGLDMRPGAAPGGEGGAAPTPSPDVAATPAAGAVNPSMNTNQVQYISLTCRAVIPSVTAPGTTIPESAIAFAVENELKNSSYFDPTNTALTGQLTRDDATGTFSFGVTLSLKKPLKL